MSFGAQLGLFLDLISIVYFYHVPVFSITETLGSATSFCLSVGVFFFHTPRVATIFALTCFVDPVVHLAFPRQPT